MKDLFFKELKDNYITMRNNKSTNDKAGRNSLLEVVNRLVELSRLARNEGLLALEEETMKEPNIPGEEYLYQMLTLIVDGTDPMLVEEICSYRYFADGLEGYAAIRYMMMLAGCLAIQAGDNPICIEYVLLAMLPSDLSLQYRQQKEKEKTEQKELTYGERIAKLCAKSTGISSEDKGYHTIKITDYAVANLSDAALQRALQDVDTADLAVAMKGFGVGARKNVFMNLSERFGLMLADDMEFMGPVRIKDIENACTKIFFTIMKLLECGEIVCKVGDTLLAVEQIFFGSESDSAGGNKSVLTKEEIESLLCQG